MNRMRNWYRRWRRLPLQPRLLLSCGFAAVLLLPFDTLPGIDSYLLRKASCYPLLFGLLLALPSLWRLIRRQWAFRIPAIVAAVYFGWTIAVSLVAAGPARLDGGTWCAIGKFLLGRGFFFSSGFFFAALFFIVPFQTARRVFSAALLCCLIGCSLYGLVEILWICHCPAATRFLEFWTPCFRAVATQHGWWPPLLWESGRVRTFFAEPSFFAFAAVPMWLALLPALPVRRHKVIGILLAGWVLLLLFLTFSRLGYLMLAAGLLLLAPKLFLTGWKTHRWRLPASILTAAALAFLAFLAILRLSDSSAPSSEPTVQPGLVEQTFQTKLPNGGSLVTRRYMLELELAIIADTPVEGHGLDGYSAAIAGRLAGRQQLPPEVALWYQYHNYSRLNVYTGSWIESGPVGLLLLLVFLAMPLGPVLWSLRRGIRLETAAVAAGYCTLLIGLNATEMLQFVFFLFWGMTAAAGLHELSSQRKQITDES